ncbi:MAG TPA: hypothetical protein VHT28_11090, partial [Silvibacterium sp.]|nr:hypothetical protein [Silvibacterium sp.]
MKEEKLAKSQRAQETIHRPHPNVDRLIELASDDKPAEILSAEEAKDSKENPMWKILLQLKPFLPYLTRLLPLLDIGIIPVQNADLSKEVRQSVAKIQTIQRDVNIAVQDQGVQLKRLEEELTRLRQASEKYAAEQAGFAEELKSIGKWV